MNTDFNLNPRMVYRMVCAMLAALLFVASIPFFNLGHADAAQMSQRSIQLSDSGASANASIATGQGSGVGVKYRVSFTAANPAASMVIDFCSNNPIINDSCIRPTGMVTSAVTLNSNQETGAIYASNGWAVSSPSTGIIKLANDGNAAHDIAAGQQVFELSGITNPSTVGTFYARMYTYQGNTQGVYSTNNNDPTQVGSNTPPGSGGVVDYGGVALSTANTVTITARVQETLTFCVTKASHATWTSTHGCDDPVVGNPLNYPALTLGHGNAGATPTLDPSQIDTAAVFSQISTNANSGAVINMRNSNGSCGGLSADGGSTCAIPAVAGNTSAPYTAGPMSPGTAAFGMYATNGTADAGGNGIAAGLGSNTATAAYRDPGFATFANGSTLPLAVPASLRYGMDNQTAATAGANPATQNGSVNNGAAPGYFYGSTVASTPGPVSRVNNTFIFAATAALTTPAGIYTANMSFVATGTF